MAVTMNIISFWCVTSCSLVDSNYVLDYMRHTLEGSHLNSVQFSLRFNIPTKIFSNAKYVV
jgi:hypothetical protein